MIAYNTTTQSKYGGDNQDYDGGHLIGTLFKGPAEKINIVPQLAKQNRYGKWRKMEQKWTKKLDQGKDVEVEILVEYGDDGLTPKSIFGDFKVNSGEPIPFEFDN
ncbi:MAG: hypothetical protein GY928_38125 [Colwellia sp.]|nr:hypothetical protein [Colwellia sp.]